MYQWASDSESAEDYFFCLGTTLRDNLGVKKVSAPLKNQSKCPTMCFARKKKNLSESAVQ
jgi:hypothetical protein